MKQTISLNHKSLRDTYTDYDVFFFDLWGVIIEGGTTYPGVVDVMNEILQTQKVYFISNVPRPSYRMKKILTDFGLKGITEEMIITSGNLTRSIIQEQKPVINSDKVSIFHLGSDRNRDLLHGVDHLEVASPWQSDVVLLSLYRDENDNINEFDDVLNEVAKSQKLTVCANPDITIPKQNIIRYCAGYFAQKVQAYGGNVVHVGKPGNEIFQVAFDKEPDIPRHRMLMIGDTLETDILGANNSGIHSALVLTGNCSLHHKHVSDITEKLNLIAQNCKKSGIVPTFTTSII